MPISRCISDTVKCRLRRIHKTAIAAEGSARTADVSAPSGPAPLTTCKPASTSACSSWRSVWQGTPSARRAAAALFALCALAWSFFTTKIIDEPIALSTRSTPPSMACSTDGSVRLTSGFSISSNASCIASLASWRTECSSQQTFASSASMCRSPSLSASPSSSPSPSASATPASTSAASSSLSLIEGTRASRESEGCSRGLDGASAGEKESCHSVGRGGGAVCCCTDASKKRSATKRAKAATAHGSGYRSSASLIDAGARTEPSATHMASNMTEGVICSVIWRDGGVGCNGSDVDRGEGLGCVGDCLDGMCDARGAGTAAANGFEIAGACLLWRACLAVCGEPCVGGVACVAYQLTRMCECMVGLSTATTVEPE
mmetsp:Transcript_37129/g.81596  ORF Transcript_37129/g.81596 Transcript_37129/m.81596 type:complete len:375 (+) Transcript_37129:272-1396(+)